MNVRICSCAYSTTTFTTDVKRRWQCVRLFKRRQAAARVGEKKWKLAPLPNSRDVMCIDERGVDEETRPSSLIEEPIFTKACVDESPMGKYKNTQSIHKSDVVASEEESKSVLALLGLIASVNLCCMRERLRTK